MSVPVTGRPRRLAPRLAAGVLGVTLVALLVLGGEAAVTLRRTFLSADSAPPATDTEVGAAGQPLVRLVMIGDSTAAGVGASTTSETVGGQLASALAADSHRVALSNVAVSGSRASDLAPQVSRVLLDRPDVAVILIGANDATHRTGLGSVRRDVAEAVRRLRRGGIAVVLGTCPDMGAARAFPQPLRLVVAWQGRRVAAAERAVGRAAGAEVVDIGRQTGPAMRADSTTLAGDDFHPSDRGYRLWVQALLPAVLATVGREPASG
jgi:lysophospholipase L1-like esterase